MGLPAVIVCHGYLANLAFMEIPMAADLTHLGIGALFIDRRGQGRSGGSLWPVPQARQRFDDLEPDIAAAVGYLRSQPVIDPTRIALLGHSDGATAAIARASADWDIRATVAISASVAQWRFVNHVAPQNLLLIYGAADRFVLNDTDRTLIALSTRGYLVTPGRFGEFADGSARRLLRVPGRGHVGVFYDDLARQEVLKWLRASLWEADLLRSGSSPETSIELSGRRTLWVVLGAAAILIALLSPTRESGVRQQREPHGERQRALAKEEMGHRWTGIRARDSSYLLMLCGLWPAGLLLAPWLARQLSAVVPGQEGSVFTALLLGPTITLTLVGAPILRHRLVAGQDKGNVRSVRRSAMWGVASGAFFAAAIYAAVRVLALHHYDTALGPPRLVLLMAFVAVSLPAFAALEVWLQCASSGRPWAAAGGLLLLAAITAGLSGHLFERMSVAPGYLLSAVLVVCACH
ncbi:MAG: alpha/beta hydrolase, partial [Candidatus Binatia bacterium]